ncbi:hypothetical protein, partial [Ruthenibacterium lactatiformans]
MQKFTGYFPTESLEPNENRLFSRSALNEGYLFRGSIITSYSNQLLSPVQNVTQQDVRHDQAARHMERPFERA